MTEPCLWCGAPTVELVIVEPADINARTKKVRKAEKRAPACEHHARRINAQDRRQELLDELRRQRARRARARSGSVTRVDAQEAIDAIEIELDELEGVLA